MRKRYRVHIALGRKIRQGCWSYPENFIYIRKPIDTFEVLCDWKCGLPTCVDLFC